MNACASSVIEPPPASRAELPPLAPVRAPAFRRRSLVIGVVGPGRVGSALLKQIRTARPRLEHDLGLSLRLCGVATRKRMWLDCDDPELNAREGGAQIWRPSNLNDFADYVHGDDGRAALLVDCSASDEVADHYAGWLATGLHVVTPNKLACSGPLARWRAIRTACASGARFRYESTVCAGLPIVQTLRDLIDTGDELLGIEGMFSGTLAWLCNRHDGQQPFSTLLREARALGYTEPDPREDLSGLDVARKLVILAREAGLCISLDDVEVQSLLPPELEGLSTEAFLQRMDTLDAPMACLLAKAQTANGVLRHVGSLDRQGHARVRLEVLPATHAFAHTHFTDNVVQFRTMRYRDNPMLVQGPGAGPEVTAAGAFSDVLRIADSLAAHA